MAQKTYYLTTPIYYPSDKLHIGHAYTTVAADSMTRFKRMLGYDVMFLTGTDEHGQKIERKAKDKGVTPKEYVDEIVDGIKKLWELMDVKYDDFIRTTDQRHEVVVQKIFKQLYDQGDIYKSEYEGWYCTDCESFWLERQLVDGKCPDCGRSVETAKEESYFFRLSKYAPRLIDYIKSHPDFIQPASRANEMIKNFLEPGLEDLAVSRTSFTWGIPVSFDEKHVVYVWIDALSNYITALGYGSEDDSKFQKYWPADVHLVGKEIVRFHTIIWPIMLMALGLPLPKQVFGHGWLNLDGNKMSKSRGNVVDPTILCAHYSTDAIRYFLMREMPFGMDGDFNIRSLLTRINSDLANDLGNLVSRTVAMIQKYNEAKIPCAHALEEVDAALRENAQTLYLRVEDLMDKFQFSNALAEIWKLVGACNRYIDQTQPWVLGKNPDCKERLDTVLYNLAECVRIVTVCIAPFMPSTPARIYAQLGISQPQTWESIQSFGQLPSGLTVAKGEALFPRIDIEKEMDALEEELRLTNAKKGTEKAEEAKEVKQAAKENEEAIEEKKEETLIDIEDIAKVQLRVALVTACEPVPKAKKLLKLTLKVGQETRTVVSGIALHYTSEQMVGKKVILAYNLRPAKLRGILSEGMILAAEDEEGHLNLLTVDGDAMDGAIIS